MCFFQYWLRPISWTLLTLALQITAQEPLELAVFALPTTAKEPLAGPGNKTLKVEDYKLTLVIPLLRDIGQLEGRFVPNHPTPKDFEQAPDDLNTYIWYNSAEGVNVKIVILNEEGDYIKRLHTDDHCYPKLPRQSLYLLFGDGVSHRGGWDFFLSTHPHIDEIYLAIIDTDPAPDKVFEYVYQTYPELPGQRAVTPQRLLGNTSSSTKNIFGLEARKAVVRFCFDSLRFPTAQVGDISDFQQLHHDKYCEAYAMYHADLLVSEPDMEDLLIKMWDTRYWRYAEDSSTTVLEGCNKTEERQQHFTINFLAHAARRGFEGMVRFLIAHKAEINTPDFVLGIPLQRSIYFGHLGIARLLLENGADPNIDESNSTTEFSTALNDAIKRKHHEAVRLLLEYGADIDHCIRGKWGGETALTTAIDIGDPDIVKLLLEHGASINQPQELDWKRNVFSSAAIRGNDAVFRMLLQYSRGQDIKDKAETLCTGMGFAARNGWTEVVQQVLAEKIHPDCCGTWGSPLVAAAREGHITIVQTLLDAGATPVIKGPISCNAIFSACEDSSHSGGFNGSSREVGKIDSLRLLLKAKPAKKEVLSQALKYAAVHSLPMVKLLLDHGAIAEELDQDFGQQDQPLWGAISRGQVQIARFLLESGAQLRHTTVEPYLHNSPLYEAIFGGQAPMLQLLIDHGANISSVKGSVLETSYIRAAQGGFAETMKLLLLSGADVNTLCDDLWTCPLHLAIWNEHTAVVEILLQAGANPNLHNKMLPSATQLASSIGHRPILDLILRHGGDPNIDDVDHESALMLAVTDSRTKAFVQVVSQLLDHGADITYRSRANQTILEAIASSKGKYAPQNAKILLEHGADIYQRTTQNRTILEQAAINGTLWFVKLMVEGPLKDVTPDEKTAIGEMAAFQAADYGHNDTLAILLQHDFPLDHSIAITSSLRNAVSKGYLGVAEVLLDYTKDKYEIPPEEIEKIVDDAVEGDKQDFIRLFFERKVIDLSFEVVAKMLFDAVGRKHKVAKVLVELGRGIPISHEEL